MVPRGFTLKRTLGTQAQTQQPKKNIIRTDVAELWRHKNTAFGDVRFKSLPQMGVFSCLMVYSSTSSSARVVVLTL
jgi:hypothetical protein